MASALQLEPAPIRVIRRIPFVKKLHWHNGSIDIQTSARRFRLLAETERSYLTRSAVSQLLAWLQQQGKQPRRIILLARHIPRPVAERLIEAHVNFADDAGNVHLTLGDTCNWTVVGRPALEPVSQRRPISPALVQLLFQFVTYPESVDWPLRRLEVSAGISKSKASQVKADLIAGGLLKRRGKQYKLALTDLLADRLVSGYTQVLRPKLVIGTFRSPEKTAEPFLARLLAQAAGQYSLSGGPAAYLLQHYYRAPEVPLFIKSPTPTVIERLRLLPDREGPITLLRAFGDLVFWEERDRHRIGPPWLIYAELLSSSDPRAHEAAAEFRREFLGNYAHK